MTFKIVVARYNENLNWLNNFMSDCMIYNKGKKLDLSNEIILPNVGRESETYLRFIIDNYDNLPDIVIFTQGKISDHCKDHNNYLQKIKDEAEICDKSLPRIIHISRALRDSCFDPEWNLNNKHINNDSERYLNHEEISFLSWFKQNISKSYPNPINIYINGIFAVKKELILIHPKEYYENLIKYVNHHVDPMEGHFFERAWYYIFPI
jgi:hypothetical protein